MRWNPFLFMNPATWSSLLSSIILLSNYNNMAVILGVKNLLDSKLMCKEITLRAA